MRLQSWILGVLALGILSCGEPDKATLSVIIANQSTQSETVTALRFPQSSVTMFEGKIVSGGWLEDHGIAVPNPHNLIEIDLRSDANIVRTFKLDLMGHGKVNSIGRVEYRVEINEQGMRVVPVADWPKPDAGTARPPPPNLPAPNSGPAIPVDAPTLPGDERPK